MRNLTSVKAFLLFFSIYLLTINPIHAHGTKKMKHLLPRSRIYLIMVIEAFKQSSFVAYSSPSDQLSIPPVDRQRTTSGGQSSIDVPPKSSHVSYSTTLPSVTAKHESFNKTTFLKSLMDNRNQSSLFPTIEMPVRELSDILRRALASTIANEREVRATIRQLLDHLLKVDATDYILNSIRTLQPDIQERLSDAIRRLKRHEPLQYIIGSVYFADMLFKVTPAVLIPRPETEEWVIFLTQRVSNPTSILDIGTGSGCIAITLKQKFPQAVVDAIDVSREALDVARYNAANIGVEVHFTEADILTESLLPRNWSLIVSNPPYVLQREKLLMQPNVLNYEPHLALFVDDAHPLLFYERIVHLATRHLNSNGVLSMEINEAFGKEVIGLLRRANFKEASLHKDMQEKDRWVVAVLGY